MLKFQWNYIFIGEMPMTKKAFRIRITLKKNSIDVLGTQLEDLCSALKNMESTQLVDKEPFFGKESPTEKDLILSQRNAGTDFLVKVTPSKISELRDDCTRLNAAASHFCSFSCELEGNVLLLSILPPSEEVFKTLEGIYSCLKTSESVEVVEIV